MTLKKIMFWIMLIFVGLALLAETTVLQMAPLVGYLFFGYQEIWLKKDRTVVISVLSLVMVLINLSLYSYVDVVTWIVALIVALYTAKGGESNE